MDLSRGYLFICEAAPVRLKVKKSFLSEIQRALLL